MVADDQNSGQSDAGTFPAARVLATCLKEEPADGIWKRSACHIKQMLLLKAMQKDQQQCPLGMNAERARILKSGSRERG
ncbi:hypothetical protein EMCRGX_G028165 [Ephydatia muelleri]